MESLGDHGRRKEASSSSSQEGCGTLEASGHRSGMAELARRPFAEEAIEASDSQSVEDVEVSRTFEIHDQMVGRGASYQKGCKSNAHVDE